jgi:apolipoprotein N-acyltransferase
MILGLPIALSYIIKSNYEDSGVKAEVIVLQPNIDPYSDKYNTKDEQIAENLSALIDNQKPLEEALILSPETVFADGTRLKSIYASTAFSFTENILERYPEASLVNGISMVETGFNQLEKFKKVEIAKEPKKNKAR